MHKSCIYKQKVHKSCIKQQKLHKSCIYKQRLHKSCIFNTINQSCTKLCMNHAYINHLFTLFLDFARQQTVLIQGQASCFMDEIVGTILPPGASLLGLILYTGLVPLTTRLTSVILSNFPADEFDDLSPLLLIDKLAGLSHFVDTRGISVAHWYRLILCIGLTPLTVNGFWYSRYLLFRSISPKLIYLLFRPINPKLIYSLLRLISPKLIYLIFRLMSLKLIYFG